MNKNWSHAIGKMIINPQEQFEMAMRQWEQGNYRHAEKWLRYASIQGHALAKQHLEKGIQLGHFLTTNSLISALAIEILEQLITPQPTEGQIQLLEKYLSIYLCTHYGLDQNIH